MHIFPGAIPGIASRQGWHWGRSAEAKNDQKSGGVTLKVAGTEPIGSNGKCMASLPQASTHSFTRLPVSFAQRASKPEPESYAIVACC